jgi:pantoate--beta-alanine ligase
LREGIIGAGFASIDYAELSDAERLTPVTAIDGTAARLFVAARIGGTRLIDNMPVHARA